MISKKTKYALKALQYLAVNSQKGPILIAEMAGRERIPQKFLEAILLELKNAGILASRKGKGGGYFLARKPEHVSLSVVLRILEGPLAPLPCLSKTAHKKCDDCIDETTCGIKKVMQEAYESQIQCLEKTTLKDLENCCQSAVQPSYEI